MIDPDHLENLLLDCHSRACKIAYKYGERSSQVEEFAQEATLKVYGFLQTTHKELSSVDLRRFCLKIVSNHWFTLNRKNRKNVKTTYISGIEAMAAEILDYSDHARVLECVTRLPPKDREIVNEKFYEKKTYEEIGRTRGYTKGWAFLEIKKILTKLQSCMGVVSGSGPDQ